MKRQLFLLLGLALLLAACGGDESTSPPPTSQPDPTATPLSRPPTRVPTAERPWFGIGFNQLIPNVLSILVDSGGPADQAGLQNADIITSINGIDVSPENIAEVFADFQVGETISVSVLRGEETLEFQVTLAAAPDSAATESQVLGLEALGIALEVTDTQIKVVDMLPFAQGKEIEIGDVIIAVNNTAFTSMEDAITLLTSLPAGEVTLTLDDNGTAREVTLMAAEPGTTPTPFLVEPGSLSDVVTFDPNRAVWTMVEIIAIGPLGRPGLQVGDQITTINGGPITPADLRTMLNVVTPETELVLNVIRDGQTLTITGTGEIVPGLLSAYSNSETTQLNRPTSVPPLFLTPRATSASTGGLPFDPSTLNRDRANPVRTGFISAPVTDQIATDNGLTPGTGIVVLQLEPDAPTFVDGIRVGDIITAVDGELLTIENPFTTILEPYQAGAVVTLDVIRAGEPLKIDLTLLRSRGNALPFILSGSPSGSETTALPPVQLPPLPIPTQSS